MAPLPAGYVRVASDDGSAEGVAVEAIAPWLSDTLRSGSIYGYAATAPELRALEGGRGPAFAVPIAGIPAVVRHARHGGMLAGLTRDLFLPPTRAPHELMTSVRLRDAGVATPEVLAYVVYGAAAGLRRADVVTREVLGGIGFARILAASRSDAGVDALAVGAESWDAVRTLIHSLGRVGAFHADLNVGNVLITFPDGPPIAYALDIDRVVWRRPGDPRVARANLARLHRSARKQGLL